MKTRTFFLVVCLFLVGTVAYSQEPIPTFDGDSWDYCPSVPGIQNEYFVCPGPISPKPVRGNVTTNSRRSLNPPIPTSSNRGSGGTDPSRRPRTNKGWIERIKDLLN